MPLNKQKGNMYDFVSHTWNVIKGICFHDCLYCYMKKWKSLKAIRIDESELKTNLGKDNFIFVGSSADMFAQNIPSEWILKTLEHCRKFENKYLFQTKEPKRVIEFKHFLPKETVICSTVESNRFYKDIMRNSPKIEDRIYALRKLSNEFDIYITIEPVLDFDTDILVSLLKEVMPKQVNIGADSGGHKMPEPSKEKLLNLIEQLSKFTKVVHKKNVKRLIK